MIRWLAPTEQQRFCPARKNGEHSDDGAGLDYHVEELTAFAEPVFGQQQVTS